MLPSTQLLSLENNRTPVAPNPTRCNCKHAETAKLVTAEALQEMIAEKVKLAVAAELIKHHTPKTQPDKSKNTTEQSVNLQKHKPKTQPKGPKLTKEQQKEDDRIWFALLKTFSCTTDEKVSFQVRRLVDCFLTRPYCTTENIQNKHFDRLQSRAWKGEDDCVIHGGRKCFCWKFEYDGKWRAYNFRVGWVGVRTPFAPAEDERI